MMAMTATRRMLAMMRVLLICCMTAACSIGGSSQLDPTAQVAGEIREGDDWPAWGRTPGEQHFSPLDSITASNVGRLELAWHYDIEGIELATSTPLEVGGILYTSTGYSVLRAFDATTGKLLWQYDPEVPQVAGQRMRGGWGSRGLAYDQGRLFVGTSDGRLIAVDAKSGKPVWSAMTLQPGDLRFISGAPRTFDGKVIIGHGGADIGPVRGYVTAYDQATGRQLWRFYTVPGNPAVDKDETTRIAARTWAGEWWKYGGGGTVWNAMTYDPELKLVFIGTGNGAPWNRKIRSAGKGDNLFLSSIVALDADTGAYRWHYQLNPGESWDYNAAMDMELATLAIDGRPRKVLMQAPKNGFFYVIDRTNGKLISAKPFAKVTWASRIDTVTGRPVEAPGVRYEKGPVTIWPGPTGAHNWQSMSFNPATGLVYIPALDLPGSYDDTGFDIKNWRHRPGAVPNFGVKSFIGDTPVSAGQSHLIAWDPVRQRKVWSVPTPGVWNGGTVATAGNLVFQGTANGKFTAYAADTGRVLRSFNAGAGIIGTPITYLAKGRQYVTVLAGYGGGGAMFGSLSAQFGWDARAQPRRVLTFALEGKDALPAMAPVAAELPMPDPTYRREAEREAQGNAVFGDHCAMCHGGGAISGGTAPDLRRSPVIFSKEAFGAVVQEGALLKQGMPKFGDLSPAETQAVRHYLRGRANELRHALQ